MRGAVTGKEMAAIPPKDRVYTCQQCSKVSMDNEQFRLIQFLGIAFVICFDCILGDQKVELERKAAEKALTEAAKEWREYTHIAPTSAPCAEWWLNRRVAALGLTAEQEREAE